MDKEKQNHISLRSNGTKDTFTRLYLNGVIWPSSIIWFHIQSLCSKII